jgi:hypothetical protein
MISSAVVKSLNVNDGVNYFLGEVIGLRTPPIRRGSYNIAGKNYGKHAASYYGKRPFALKGWVKGNSSNDLITKTDALASATDITNGDITITFTLTNGKQVYLIAGLLNLDMMLKAGVIDAVEYQAQFEAAYPFLLSTAVYTHTIGLASGGGGKVPPDTMPTGLTADTGGKISALNNGNAYSHPTARITGVVTNPVLRNNTTGEEISFILSLASGEYIDIDFLEQTVTDNTGRNRLDVASGDFFSLKPGVNEIKFSASSTDTSTQASIAFHDAYLNL